MIKQIIISLLAVVTLSCLVYESEATLEHMQRMEQFLSGQNFQDVQGNMKKLSDWLEQKRSSKLKSWWDREFLHTLEQFVAMDKFEGEDYCGMESYKNLKANQEEMNQLWQHHQLNSRPDDRTGKLLCIEKIVYRKRDLHANRCFTKYPQLFKSMLEKADSKSTQTIHQLLRANYESYSKSIKEDDYIPKDWYYSFLVKPIEEFEKGDIRVAYNSLKKLAGSKLPSKDANEAEKVVDEYLVKPCENYLTDFHDVFEPTKFDASNFKLDDLDNHEENEDFYYGWFVYNFCGSISSGSYFVEGLTILARTD